MIALRDLRVAMTLEQFWHRVPGGTAVAAFEMARSVTQHGIDLVGVAARHKEALHEQWSAPEVPIEQLPLPRALLYESWHRLRWPQVQRATGPIDVIHATTMAIPPKSAPLVVTIHDLAWLKNPAHVTARGLRFFQRGFELAKRDADLVLCPSRATVDACTRAGIETSRMRHVSLGVTSLKANEEDVRRARERYQLDRPYLMWTGTIEPRKNLTGLIDAYRLLERDLDLVLVGPKGWNEDLGRLEGDLKERVRVLGFVPAPDLRALYAGAEVFCYPSLLEGFGFPVLEAMAQGTPVVTSQGTSTEELAGSAGVLVDPRDPSAIAAGIGSVLDDGPLAAKLASEGLERVGAYSWDRTAELLIEAYMEVAG